MVGALHLRSHPGLTSGVYDICWTLLLLARGASGLEIGISWTLFAVPFVLVAKPSGWLADHMDRRALVLAGIGASTVLCASYPFIHNVPALVLLGALGGDRFRRRHARRPVTAHPGLGSLRSRADPGDVRHQSDRVHGGGGRCRRSRLRHRLVAALRHRGRRLSSWRSSWWRSLWRTVPGRVDRSARRTFRPIRSGAVPPWWLRCWAVGAGRGQRRGAVGAAAGRRRHLAQTLGALAYRLLLGAHAQPVHQRVDRLDHQEEDDRGDEHEREQRIQEAPVGELRAVDGEGEVVEVLLAEDGGAPTG